MVTRLRCLVLRKTPRLTISKRERWGGSLPNFFRCVKLECEGVDLIPEFGCQRVVDEAVARQPSLAGERG